MVRGINDATEEITSTLAASKNGLRRSGKGGNLNCDLELHFRRVEGCPRLSQLSSLSARSGLRRPGER
jgi:hypothetical protein